MKQGILLAGGSGKRLGPITQSINKQMLPIYDKPLIYYSLSTLILSGVKLIALVCNPDSVNNYRKLLGDGDSFGIRIEYVIQKFPEGIPQALTISESVLDISEPVFLALGDNIIYGPGTGREMSIPGHNSKAKIYLYPVSNPENFGIVELDEFRNPTKIVEKPEQSTSNFAITGFYQLPADSFNYCKSLSKSKRNEYEIVDLLNIFLELSLLELKFLPRGSAWLDAGTTEGFIESSQFVRALQKRQGLLVGSPHEAAWRVGNITTDQLLDHAEEFKMSEYGLLLRHAIEIT